MDLIHYFSERAQCNKNRYKCFLIAFQGANFQGAEGDPLKIEKNNRIYPTIFQKLPIFVTIGSPLPGPQQESKFFWAWGDQFLPRSPSFSPALAGNEGPLKYAILFSLNAAIISEL